MGILEESKILHLLWPLWAFWCKLLVSENCIVFFYYIKLDHIKPVTMKTLPTRAWCNQLLPRFPHLACPSFQYIKTYIPRPRTWLSFTTLFANCFHGNDKYIAQWTVLPHMIKTECVYRLLTSLSGGDILLSNQSSTQWLLFMNQLVVFLLRRPKTQTYVNENIRQKEIYIISYLYPYHTSSSQLNNVMPWLCTNASLAFRGTGLEVLF